MTLTTLRHAGTSHTGLEVVWLSVTGDAQGFKRPGDGIAAPVTFMFNSSVFLRDDDEERVQESREHKACVYVVADEQTSSAAGGGQRGESFFARTCSPPSCETTTVSGDVGTHDLTVSGDDGGVGGNCALATVPPLTATRCPAGSASLSAAPYSIPPTRAPRPAQVRVPVLLTVARKCPAGSFSQTGETPCEPCPADTYQDRIGSLACVQCRSLVDRARTCSTFGLEGAPSSDACVQCPPGASCDVAMVEDEETGVDQLDVDVNVLNGYYKEVGCENDSVINGTAVVSFELCPRPTSCLGIREPRLLNRHHRSVTLKPAR